MTELLTPRLVQAVLEEYTLPIYGTHGITHWARVLENGLRLADETGASVRVVELFALFHDSRRVNESIDPGHGLRGAEFAASVRGKWFDLPDSEFEWLFTACQYHTDGRTDGPVTVRTCWDADRLDICRVGFKISPRRLCTEAARDPEMIRWADRRGRARDVPERVAEWLGDSGG